VFSQNQVRSPSKEWRSPGESQDGALMLPEGSGMAGGRAAIPFVWRVMGSRRRRPEARAPGGLVAQLPVMFSPSRPEVVMLVDNPDSAKAFKVRCRIAFYIIPSTFDKGVLLTARTP